MSDLELHAAEFIHHVTHVFADDRPRYLVVALRRRLDRVTRHVVEPDDVAHHSDRLVERAHPVTAATIPV